MCAMSIRFEWRCIFLGLMKSNCCCFQGHTTPTTTLLSDHELVQLVLSAFKTKPIKKTLSTTLSTTLATTLTTTTAVAGHLEYACV